MNNAAGSPADSVLRTPITQPAHLDAQSFMSTLTISPVHSQAGYRQLFTQQRGSFQLPASAQSTPASGNLSVPSDAPDPIQQLRLWRHDALVQHHITTAAFIGEKVLALTSDPNDAFWLAQAYYDARHFSRAYHVLQQRQLTEISVACRYLGAQCLVAMQRWQEALELIGEDNPFRERNVFQKQSPAVKNSDGGIRLEASMCYIRGLIYANLNNLDRAKRSYKEALEIDVKCYDAYDQLISNSLLTPDEEWELLDSLDFSILEPETASFIKVLYGVRASKYNPRAKTALREADAMLAAKNLPENPDFLLAKADLLFTQCRFADCLESTRRILSLDPYKFNAMPLHLTCLHELGRKNELFKLSHDMTERHPEEPVSWLAVGIYYMSITKVAEARRYFSKASIMNPRFGSAWIGFAHSFASEGEHDQAISAYTTAARLFQGTHLPSLFLGMQHLHLHNFVLAEEYLMTAYKMCNSDPLLLNELGVVCFHKHELQKAIDWFKMTIALAAETGGIEKSWVATHANLGHAFRKLRRWDEAFAEFELVKRLTPHDAAPYSACGLMHMHLGQLDEAISNLHQALALSPSEPLATDLLSKALEESSAAAFQPLGLEDVQVDSEVDHLLLKMRESRATTTSRHLDAAGTSNPIVLSDEDEAAMDEGDMSYSD